jgi:hypothetical protein
MAVNDRPELYGRDIEYFIAMMIASDRVKRLLACEIAELIENTNDYQELSGCFRLARLFADGKTSHYQMVKHRRECWQHLQYLAERSEERHRAMAYYATANNRGARCARWTFIYANMSIRAGYPRFQRSQTEDRLHYQHFLFRCKCLAEEASAPRKPWHSSGPRTTLAEAIYWDRDFSACFPLIDLLMECGEEEAADAVLTGQLFRGSSTLDSLLGFT